jgi:hypothetical protein
MMRRSYVNVTIAVAGSLAGLMLGDTFVRRLWPLLNTETYRSILPPNARPLRFISDLIQLCILFSAGAICGITSRFTGGRRLRVPLAIAVYIYAFVRLLPYGFIEVRRWHFQFQFSEAAFVLSESWLGSGLRNTFTGTDAQRVEHPDAG